MNKEPEYWNGFWNRLIRHLFYMQTGANVFNVYKYVVGSIIAVYWMTHCQNQGVLVAAFAVMLPLLDVIGYYSIHHINKVMDYLSTKYGSHYSIKNFELQQEQVDLLKEILAQISVSPEEKQMRMLRYPIHKNGECATDCFESTHNLCNHGGTKDRCAGKNNRGDFHEWFYNGRIDKRLECRYCPAVQDCLHQEGKLEGQDRVCESCGFKENFERFLERIDGLKEVK